MLSRNVKVMDIISQVVAVGKNPAARTHRQMERQAALAALVPRMHAHFHHALADHGSVAKLGEMPNEIEHSFLALDLALTPPTPCGSSNSHRARKRLMDRAALPQNVTQIRARILRQDFGYLSKTERSLQPSREPGQRRSATLAGFPVNRF